LNKRFVVMIIDPCSYRWLIIWNRRSAPVLSIGVIPVHPAEAARVGGIFSIPASTGLYVEKVFENLKERLNLRRVAISSEQTLDGKKFVQFLSLIFLSYITKKMKNNKLFKNFTMQEGLDEFDIIECFEVPGQKLQVGEMTKKQTELYSKFGVIPPNSLQWRGNLGFPVPSEHRDRVSSNGMMQQSLSPWMPSTAKSGLNSFRDATGYLHNIRWFLRRYHRCRS